MKYRKSLFDFPEVKIEKKIRLNIKGVKPWNEMTVEERQELVNGKKEKEGGNENGLL